MGKSNGGSTIKNILKRTMLELIITKTYRIAKKIVADNRFSRGITSSFFIPYMIEPAIAILAKQKQMALFPHENWGTRLRYLLGWYEHGATIICKNLIKPGMNILDIGADVGYFARIFSQSTGPAGKVWAFEPHPQSYEMLKKNVSHLPYQNVIPVNKAAAEKKSTVTLFSTTMPAKHSLLNISSDGRSLHVKKKLLVQSVSIDELLEQYGNPSIQFVKIDIEGSELKALDGMKKTIARSPDLAMIIEFNGRALRSGGITPAHFIQKIGGFGFEISAISESTGTVNPLSDAIYAYIETGYVNLLCVKGNFLNKL